MAPRRKPQVDCIAKFLARESQPEIDSFLTHRSLDLMISTPDGPTDFFRSRPQGRLQPPFPCKRWNDTALRRFSQQSKRPIYARLAATIRAGNQIQPQQRNNQITQ